MGRWHQDPHPLAFYRDFLNEPEIPLEATDPVLEDMREYFGKRLWRRIV